jgi:predicted transporter
VEAVGVVLFSLGVQLTLATVLIGVGYGAWLLVVGSGRLAGASFLGAALVVWAYARQHQLDDRLEAFGLTGRWDTAFVPLCLSGLLLVAFAFVSGLRAGRSWRPARQRAGR